MIRKLKNLLNPQFIILSGILLRLLVIPFTLNWDLWANTNLVSQFNPGDLAAFYLNPISAYPPLIYGIIQMFLTPLSAFSGMPLKDWLMSFDLNALNSTYVFRILFLIKMPYLLADIASGFLFSGFFREREKTAGLVMWWLNPAVIFLTCIWSNVDIYVVLFILLSLRLFYGSRQILAVAALSIAISLKVFPVFFLPFLILSFKGTRRIITAIGVSALTILLAHIQVLPIFASYMTHVASGGYRDLILFSTLPIGPGRSLIIVYLGYFILLWNYWGSTAEKKRDILFYLFIVLLIIFGFSRFGLQWFIWLAPFLSIYAVRQKELRLPVFAVNAVYFAMVILSQTSLNIGMLGPIEPSLWRFEYPLKTLLGEKQINVVFDSLHTLFAATLLYTGYKIHKNRNLIV